MFIYKYNINYQVLLELNDSVGTGEKSGYVRLTIAAVIKSSIKP